MVTYSALYRPYLTAAQILSIETGLLYVRNGPHTGELSPIPFNRTGFEKTKKI